MDFSPLYSCSMFHGIIGGVSDTEGLYVMEGPSSQLDLSAAPWRFNRNHPQPTSISFLTGNNSPVSQHKNLASFLATLSYGCPSKTVVWVYKTEKITSNRYLNYVFGVLPKERVLKLILKFPETLGTQIYLHPIGDREGCSWLFRPATFGSKTGATTTEDLIVGRVDPAVGARKYTSMTEYWYWGSSAEPAQWLSLVATGVVPVIARKAQNTDYHQAIPIGPLDPVFRSVGVQQCLDRLSSKVPSSPAAVKKVWSDQLTNMIYNYLGQTTSSVMTAPTAPKVVLAPSMINLDDLDILL